MESSKTNLLEILSNNFSLIRVILEKITEIFFPESFQDTETIDILCFIIYCFEEEVVTDSVEQFGTE